MSQLFDPIQAASAASKTCLVAFSGGKDSVVTLDLCARYFERIEVFFMYQIPGLSFQEATLKFAEKKYGITIHRLPHFELSNFLHGGSFRKPDYSVPIIGINDIYRFMRIATDIWWIAAGERIADSIVRRAMMKKSGCIDVNRGRFYPVANWNKAQIVTYIERHGLKAAPETATLNHSFSSLMPRDMAMMKKHYPMDYQKISRWFPFVEASVMKYEADLEEKQTAKV